MLYEDSSTDESLENSSTNDTPTARSHSGSRSAVYDRKKFYGYDESEKVKA